MLFMQLDHGAIPPQRNGPRDSEDDSLRHWQSPHHEGNGEACSGCGALIYKYGNRRVRSRDGVHLSYDRMATFLAPYGNRDALEVARNLDKKIEDLLRQAAA